MRKFFADITARVTFSLVTGTVIEVLISGMTLRQSLLIRAMSLPLIILLARPYGMFRDWGLKKFHVTHKQSSFRGRVKKFVVETSAYTVFYVPVYAGQLTIAGATLLQALEACASLVIFVAPLGRPFGIYLDFIRKKLFRITNT